MSEEIIKEMRINIVLELQKNGAEQLFFGK